MKAGTLLMVMAVAIATGSIEMAQARSNTVRDPQIAVQEEYELAVKRGTVEAIGVFIARHPDSALINEAQKRRRELIAKDPKRGQP